MRGSRIPAVLARILPVAMALALTLSIAVLPGAFVQAQTASGQPYVDPEHAKSLIEDPADKARYKQLAEELRCLVCQNQTLADSDASLAVDLRRQLETMVIEGRSDEQIKSYLVERYGEFVLYRPPVQGNTWLLWFGPFALLAIGIAIWFLVRRDRSGSGRVAADDVGARELRENGLPAGAVPAGAPGSVAPRPGKTSNDVTGSAPNATQIERARRLLDGDR
jgi:cytochrome c-type biogenesis protein CcmH